MKIMKKSIFLPLIVSLVMVFYWAAIATEENEIRLSNDPYIDENATLELQWLWEVIIIKQEMTQFSPSLFDWIASDDKKKEVIENKYNELKNRIEEYAKRDWIEDLQIIRNLINYLDVKKNSLLNEALSEQKEITFVVKADELSSRNKKVLEEVIRLVEIKLDKIKSSLNEKTKKDLPNELRILKEDAMKQLKLMTFEFDEEKLKLILEVWSKNISDRLKVFEMSTRDLILPKEEVKVQTRDDKTYIALSKLLNPKIEKLSNQKLSVIYQKIEAKISDLQNNKKTKDSKVIVQLQIANEIILEKINRTE